MAERYPGRYGGRGGDPEHVERWRPGEEAHRREEGWYEHEAPHEDGPWWHDRERWLHQRGYYGSRGGYGHESRGGYGHEGWQGGAQPGRYGEGYGSGYGSPHGDFRGADVDEGRVQFGRGPGHGRGDHLRDRERESDRAYGHGPGHGGLPGGYAPGGYGRGWRGEEYRPERGQRWMGEGYGGPLDHDTVARQTERFHDAGRQARRYGGSRWPRSYQRSDERIREDIYERMLQDPYIDCSDVTVTVESGNVRLEGTVPERHMKHVIENLADDCPGVRDIDNRLRVGRSSETAGGSP